MDILEWIKEKLKPELCNSDKFIYDDMDSQSGRALPIIYKPFDPTKKSHWRDRGSMHDYLISTLGEGKLLMDFGPGDGWPSLIVAPYASRVIGVEGSIRRTKVCTENAVRLEISNAEYIHVPQGSPLPFEGNTFDGIMAASSVEQTQDPESTLKELFRVLKPAGRLRISYESLEVYRNGQERDVWLEPISDNKCRLIIFDRYIDKEFVVQYGLTFALSSQEISNSFLKDASRISYEDVTVPILGNMRSYITESRVCTTIHPSGKTLVLWLREIGFGDIIPSHSGSMIAGQLFESLPEVNRPGTLGEVDDYLKPILRVVVNMQAPIEMDPMITAIKIP
jgi:ubiquinone/menaquinone biosynthesis C-methylase UbiE